MQSSPDTQLSFLRGDVKSDLVPQKLDKETLPSYHARLATLYKLSTSQIAVELGQCDLPAAPS